MSVIIILHTDIGNLQSGSILYMTPKNAQKYIASIQDQVDVRSRYPGTYWFQDGATLQIFPKGSTLPPSLPGASAPTMNATPNVGGVMKVGHAKSGLF